MEGHQLEDLRFVMQTRRRIQGIFQVNDSVVFMLNLALQLANSQENLEDIDSLSLRYELSMENAVKLSLAARLLKDTVPDSMVESMTQPGYPSTLLTSDPSVPSYAAADSGSTPVSSTLYVRNIPVTTTEHEIVAVFQNFGPIKEVRMQRDKQTGQFFGSVFVEYLNPAAAKLAVLQINQKMWGNNVVHVDFAKERKDAPARDQVKQEEEPISPGITLPGGSSNEAQKLASATLFVGGLPLDIDRGSLYALFARFGTLSSLVSADKIGAIVDVRVLTDKITGLPKGVAFVDFGSTESAVAAKEETNGTPFMGKTLKVSFADNPSSKKEGSGASTMPVNARVPYPPAMAYPGYDASYYGAYGYPYGQ